MKADEKKCSQCAEFVKAEARICRFCGHTFDEQSIDVATSNPVASPATEGKSLGKGRGFIVGTIIILIILVSIFSSDDPTPSVPDSAIEAAAGAAVEAAEDDEVVAEEPTSVLTGPQTNAKRSAEQYLAMTGFSRKGLIEQLSSDAGNGYAVSDATAAVDSLTVDWNEQAVRSAEQYLEMMGFSCSGLIEQLSSDAGSGYTRSEARYGAERAGAC